jgi:hypothetical protein
VARLRQRTVEGATRRWRNEAPMFRTVGVISWIIIFVCWCQRLMRIRKKLLYSRLIWRRATSDSRSNRCQGGIKAIAIFSQSILFMANLFHISNMEMQRSERWCLKSWDNWRLPLDTFDDARILKLNNGV